MWKIDIHVNILSRALRFPDMILLVIVVIAVSLPCISSTSSGDGDKFDGLSQDSEFGTDTKLQGRNSDPRDITATEDIEEVNSHVKPRVDSRGVQSHFDPELFMTDQLFEGCLLLDDLDKKYLSEPSDLRKEDKKTHITYKKKMWPAEIPYNIFFTGIKKKREATFKNVIQKAIATLEGKTCLRFREKVENDENWLEIFSGDGCFSELGKKPKRNAPTHISLDVPCWKEGIVLHMILHALGFFHEQNRSDRDHYIQVNWGNIAHGKSSIFHRHSLYNTDMYHKLQYDFGSIMHGQRNYYSKRRNLNTMQALHNPERSLGSSELSKLDIEKIKMMFCEDFKGKITTTTAAQWSQWSSCSRSCGLGQRFRREKCEGEHCKDAKYEMKACRLQKCIQSRLDSNFESGTGVWTITEWYPQSCEWAIMKSQGSITDHTTGTGSFLQADVRNSCRLHQSAYLVSDWLPKSLSRRCIDFFYMLSGENVGDLQLYIVYKKGQQMMVWDRTGDQGDEWKQGAASLPVIEEKFRLKFVFINGRATKSKVLLDDIYIDDGPCLEGIQRCVDLDGPCKSWASQGECFRNPNYMMRKCCNACRESKCVDKNSAGVCPRRVETLSSLHCSAELWTECCQSCRDCLDWHPACENWAKTGECDANPGWMKIFCKKSCGVCMKMADRIQHR